MVDESRICPVCERPTSAATCPEHDVPTVDPSILKQFEEHALQVGDIVAGRYRVESLLGTGGMGRVYKCAQLNIQRPVALKTLKRDLMANQVHMKRFYLEARAASRLDHPNIVRIYDYGVDEEEGIAYIAMEFLKGGSLRAVLTQRKRLPEREACQLLAQVAKALVNAHEAGIIHRDLKPANVNVRGLAAGDVEAKVLDFGLAKITSDDLDQSEGLTETGVAVGTPYYMSPEQVYGKPLDHRSDLYSLGCILYELVEGQRPYRASGRVELAVKHANSPIPDLSDALVDGAPPTSGLKTVVRMLLAKNPEQRPTSTELVAVALVALSRGEAVLSSLLDPSGEVTEVDALLETNLDAALAPDLEATGVEDLIETDVGPVSTPLRDVASVSAAVGNAGEEPIIGYEMADKDPPEPTSSVSWREDSTQVIPAAQAPGDATGTFTLQWGEEDSLMNGLREWPTEVRAGVTTFLTMAYVLFVNPKILGAAIIIPDVNIGAQLMTATALAAAVGCFAMGLIARYPFALAPGMGLNAYFAYTVVNERGIPWEVALGAVFLSGIAFLLLSVTGVRAVIVQAIPNQLKLGVSAGIGLFLVAVAMQTSGLAPGGDATESADVLLVLFGLVLTGSLVWLSIPGGLVIGIVGTSVLAAFFHAPVDQVLDPSAGHAWIAAPVWPTDLVGAMDVKGALDLGLLGVIFIFLFVDFFDTAGTLVGLGTKAGYMDEDGGLPRANRAFAADAVATTVGAVLGTSTTTSYIESAAGISEGGRTGVTAIVVGLCFLASTVLWPLAGSIPAQATAPALILVGMTMLTAVRQVEWSDLRILIPVVLTVAGMPLFFSITDGISMGIVSWVVLHAGSGRSREIHPLMWGLALVLATRYGWLWIG